MAKPAAKKPAAKKTISKKPAAKDKVKKAPSAYMLFCKKERPRS